MSCHQITVFFVIKASICSILSLNLQQELANYEPNVLDKDIKCLPDRSTEEKKKSKSTGEISLVMSRNPTGRTGFAGRGILPAFGANPAIVVVMLLEERLNNNTPEIGRENDEVLRRVLLRSCPHRKYQLPWVRFPLLASW